MTCVGICDEVLKFLHNLWNASYWIDEFNVSVSKLETSESWQSLQMQWHLWAMYVVSWDLHKERKNMQMYSMFNGVIQNTIYKRLNGAYHMKEKEKTILTIIAGYSSASFPTTTKNHWHVVNVFFFSCGCMLFYRWIQSEMKSISCWHCNFINCISQHSKPYFWEFNLIQFFNQ